MMDGDLLQKTMNDWGVVLRDMVTIEQTAELLGVSVRTVRRWVAEGKMPEQYCRGHRKNFLRRDLEAMFGSPKDGNSQ
jgi:excisionase family DNA binding protein